MSGKGVWFRFSFGPPVFLVGAVVRVEHFCGTELLVAFPGTIGTIDKECNKIYLHTQQVDCVLHALSLAPVSSLCMCLESHAILPLVQRV